MNARFINFNRSKWYWYHFYRDKLYIPDAALRPYTPRHDFNPMDCTDIVIGMARGTAFRIWDYYTRDR